MTFTWQQSRGEALYIEQDTGMIFAVIHWADDNRLRIEAQYTGPNKDGTISLEPKPLGLWSKEVAAKAAVEGYVARMFPQEKE